MKVIDAHKRIDAYRTRVTGREAHSSMPELGVNAIAAAAALIGELERIGADIAREAERPALRAALLDRDRSAPSRAARRTISCPRLASFSGRSAACPSAAPAEVPRDLAAFAKNALLPRMRQVTQEAGDRHRD